MKRCLSWCAVVVLVLSACATSAQVARVDDAATEDVASVVPSAVPRADPTAEPTPIPGPTEAPSPEPTATEIEATAVEAPAEDAGSTGPLSPILELLSAAPYVREHAEWLEATDYQRAFEQAGYDLDSLCDAESPAYVEAGLDAGRVEMPLSLFHGYPLDEAYLDMPQSFGFDHCDIHATLSVFMPNMYVYGEFEPASAAETATADDRWADVLTVTTGVDSALLEWQPDLSFIRASSPMFVNVFGPPALKISPTIIVRDPPDDDGSGPRMADVGTLEQTVEMLLAEGSHSVAVSDMAFVAPQRVDFSQLNETSGEELIDESIAEAEAPPRGLPLWSSIGYGIGAPTGQVVGTIVASFANEADVAEAVERFPKLFETGQVPTNGVPVTDVLRLDAIRAEGLMMIVTVSPIDPERSLSSVLFLALGDQTELFAVGETAD